MLIQPLRQGFHEGAVNGVGARILLRLADARLDRVGREELYATSREFIDDCYDRGWLDEDLNILGSVTESVGKYHLKSLQIETLLRCNLRCGYCYCEAGKGRPEILSKDLIFRLIEDASKLGALNVDFTGGEFFLHPDWKEILCHAKAQCLSISIHTNGTPLTSDIVDFITQVGIVKIQITADGHDSKSHDAIRGLPRAFQKMVEGIKLLVQAGIEPHINIMVHKYTKENLPSIIALFRGLGASINFDWIAPFGSEKSADLGISAKEYFEAVAPIRTSLDFSERKRPCGRDLGWQSDDYEPDCGVGYSYVFITASGEMAICPVLTSRENRELFSGPNAQTHSLYDAWLNHPFFDRHRLVNCENVETCPSGTSCRGGCRANAYAISGGRLTAPNVIECNLRKNPTNIFVDFEKRYSEGDYSLPPARSTSLMRA